MKVNQLVIEEAAVKVAPDRFTWMKYKGIKAKILTHTKRNGDTVRTRLEPNDVYGYRNVKLRSSGKELIQVVLKSNDMDLAYNLSPRSFNTNILKHSRATVLPKKFKKPIDVRAIDKKDAPIVDVPARKTKPVAKKPAPKVNSIVWENDDNTLYLKYIGSENGNQEFHGFRKIKGSWVRKGEIVTDKGLDYAIDSFTKLQSTVMTTAPEVKWMTEKKKSFKNEILDSLNGFKLPNIVNTKLGGHSAQIRVKMDENNVPQLYFMVYDPSILNDHKVDELVKLLVNLSTLGLYQEVTANIISTVYSVLLNHSGIKGRAVYKPASSISAKIIKSNANSGHRFLQVTLGHIDPDALAALTAPPENVTDLGDGYLYSVEPDGNGHLAKFIEPEVLKLGRVIVWDRELNNIEPRMREIKDIHKTSPYLQKRWTSKWGDVTQVYMSDAPRSGEAGSEMYGIVYSDGSLRKVYGRDFDETITRQQYEATPEYQEQLAKENLEREERNKRNAERIRKEQEHRESILQRIDEWLNTTSISALQRGKIRTVLALPIRYAGTINGILTREEFVRTLVTDFNAKATTREEDKYKPLTNTKWNRMDAYKQREYELKLRSGEKKTVYQLGNYDVTKYEYLYAIYLGA